MRAKEWSHLQTRKTTYHSGQWLKGRAAPRSEDEEQFTCNKRVSKVIRRRIIVALLCTVIVPENSRHFRSQSDVKLKPITTWSLASSRALGSLVVFT